MLEVEVEVRGSGWWGGLSTWLAMIIWRRGEVSVLPTQRSRIHVQSLRGGGLFCFKFIENVKRRTILFLPLAAKKKKKSLNRFPLFSSVASGDSTVLTTYSVGVSEYYCRWCCFRLSFLFLFLATRGQLSAHIIHPLNRTGQPGTHHNCPFVQFVHPSCLSVPMLIPPTPPLSLSHLWPLRPPFLSGLDNQRTVTKSPPINQSNHVRL